MESNEAKKPKRPRIGQIPGAADNAQGHSEKNYEKPAFDSAAQADGSEHQS